MPIYGDKLLVQIWTEMYTERARKAAASVAAKHGKVEEELNLKTDGSSKEKGRFVVMGIMNPLEAVRCLNDPTNALLRDYLAVVERPRVITSVAVAYDYEKITELKFDGSGQVPVKQIGGDFHLTFSAANNKTLRVSDGTIFAYEFSRLIWRKNGGKLEVFDLVPDRVGWDRDNPEGTSDNPKKL